MKIFGKHIARWLYVLCSLAISVCIGIGVDVWGQSNSQLSLQSQIAVSATRIDNLSDTQTRMAVRFDKIDQKIDITNSAIRDLGDDFRSIRDIGSVFMTLLVLLHGLGGRIQFGGKSSTFNRTSVERNDKTDN
jgi:hypothetical protein